MRAGLLAPTEALSAEAHDQLQRYLDGQAPIGLAMWVKHLEPGNPPESFDHHLIVGLDEQGFEGDLEALWEGLIDELRLDGVGWIDVFPRSELEELRRFGVVVWSRDRQSDVGLDPLDFSFSWEPVEISADSTAAVAARLAQVRSVLRVEGIRRRFWKGDAELEDIILLFIGYDEALEMGEAVPAVSGAWQATVSKTPLRDGVSTGVSVALGVVDDPRFEATCLYRREDNRG